MSIFCIFPKGGNGKLLRKIMVDSAELSIYKVPKHLNMSRERQKIILKKEQETAVKKVLAGRNAHRVRQTQKLRITLDCSIAKEIAMVFL